ncbi:hypothetical protein PtB15_11B318 [Puccinia triticina]|nr:hypothetical protein PtB15_11B318 [Puccinia triticina]
MVLKTPTKQTIKEIVLITPANHKDSVLVHTINWAKRKAPLNGPLTPVSTKTTSSKRKVAEIKSAAGAPSPTATHVAENLGAEENAGDTAAESTGEEDNDDADTVTACPAKRVISRIIRDKDSNMRESSPPQQETEDVKPDITHLQEPTNLWSKARAALWQKTPLQI